VTIRLFVNPQTQQCDVKLVPKDRFKNQL